jgi:hypothetical protein
VDTTNELHFIEEYWDTETLESAALMSIIQNEGQLELVPDYEPLLMSTITMYVGYGAMWLGEKSEAAELAGDFDKAEHLDRRAGLMFDRALMYAKHMLRLRDDGFDEALGSGVDGFRGWVDESFFREEDAEVLLTAGTAWLATMQASDDGLAAAVDRPFAEALIKKSIELDEDLEGARGLMLLGTVECTVPELVGGDPKKGMKYLERALELTDRQSHGTQVAIAERCAVALQDRKMFKRLLMEVIESGDVAKYRMTNKFARRRAVRLLGQIDDLFYEDM